MKQLPRRILAPAAAGLAVLLGWEAVHHALAEDWRFLLPSPWAVLEAWRDQSGLLWRATVNTGVGAVLGFTLASVLSVASAILLSLSPLLRAALYPYLMILQMMPIVVVAPILVLWVGPGLPSVTIITALICFFPIVVNTTQGLISTDRRWVELFRMLRASRMQQLVHLRIPAALPYVLTGLRIAAVLAPIGALVGDYTAGSSAGDGGGLGFQAIVYSSQAQYAALFATAATTCLLGFVFTGAIVTLSWILLHRWHESYDLPHT